MFKQEKGITLVSLVITIIVMLILAGVSLSMVMGDSSVLDQATQAVDETERSTVKDEITALPDSKYKTTVLFFTKDNIIIPDRIIR